MLTSLNGKKDHNLKMTMKKKLLVFGVSGLTGYKIAKIASDKYDL